MRKEEKPIYEILIKATEAIKKESAENKIESLLETALEEFKMARIKRTGKPICFFCKWFRIDNGYATCDADQVPLDRFPEECEDFEEY